MSSWKLFVSPLVGLLLVVVLSPAVWAQEESGSSGDSAGCTIAVTSGDYADLPFGITSFGAGVDDGWLYVYGGNRGEAHHYTKEGQNGKILRIQLDKEGGEWEEVGEGPSMQGVAMVAHQGRLYRLGGLRATNAEGEDEHLVSTDEFASFDVKTKKWTSLPPLPEARSSHDAVIVGDVIYMVGGWTLDGDDKTWLDTAWTIDLSASELKWQALPKQPFNRRALSVAVHGDRIYAVGGMQDRGGPTRKVSYFDTTKNAWAKGPELPPSDDGDITGFGTTAFAVDGRIYVSTSTGTIVGLNSSGSQWEELAELEDARLFPRMVAFGDNKLVLVGGANMDSGKAMEVEVLEVTVDSNSKTDSTNESPTIRSETPLANDRGNWPAFLGAGAADIAADSIPVEWSGTKNLAWKIELPGYGQSSPVIWNDRVFFTSVEGPMKEQFHAICVNLADGKQLWKRTLESSQEVKSSSFVSRAAPSPVVDAERVITMFENGDLVAWSHEGEQLWKRSLVEDYGAIENGHCIGASPMQTDDAVFVLVDHNGPGYLLKVNKADGKTVWKADRSSRMSWNSPVLMTVGGKSCVLVSAKGSVDGYDLETGDVIWSYTDVVGNTSATPIPFEDGRFLVGASSGRDPSQEITNMAMQIVEDKDGRLVARKMWDAGRASCTFGSPMTYRGFAYWVGKGGILYCLDSESGKLQYKKRIGSSAWATPLGIGDRVYFFGKDGTTVVLAVGSEFRQLASNSFDDVSGEAEMAADETADEPKKNPRITYGVAAVSGSLLIRTGDVMYCVRNQ